MGSTILWDLEKGQHNEICDGFLKTKHHAGAETFSFTPHPRHPPLDR